MMHSKREGRFYRIVKLLSLSVILLGLCLAVVVPHRDTAADTSAKNVILFIGDGMGVNHVKAGGLFANGEVGTLPFESFPHTARMLHDSITTANTGGFEPTDSAAGATAMATGIKVPNQVISENEDGEPLTTLLELHKNTGKRTGLVTTSYMTDASPAAFGAHEPLRGLKTRIAEDYFERSRPNVLFGGGYIDENGDGFTIAAASEAGYDTVTTSDQLGSIDTEAQTFIAGVFGEGEIPPDGMEDNELPTLPEMTEAALNILDNGSDGLFLVVEHEGSDTYSHGYGMSYETRTGGMVRSVVELSAAVEKAIEWKENNPNTIILVLADHETGGLMIDDDPSPEGIIPSVSWNISKHTRNAVPVYADGVGAEQISTLSVNGQELIDNTDIFDILKPAVDETPWQAAAGSPTKVNVSSSYYSAGYHFTPLTDGNVTALGGYFNGTKPVRLFNKATGALLAETTVTANNDWNYTAISPVFVEEGVQYTVAVHLAGSGGSYERGVDFPITSDNVRIDASTFAGSASDPDARPTNNFTYNMIGQADIAFAPSDSGTPADTPTPSPSPTPSPTPSNEIATMITPVPGSTLSGSEVTFTWTDINRTLYLRIGSSLGGSQYYSRFVPENASSTHTVTGLPTDGSTIYVRLSTYIHGTGWQHQDYQYTANNSGSSSVDGDTPWQAAADAPNKVNINWNLAAGYHFTPLTDGDVTALGGYFNGSKTVRLFNKATGTLLAETTVTANNDWGYTAISPVSVEEGVQYTVAVYLAGSGGSYQRVDLPLTSGDIRIDGGTYTGTVNDPDARPILVNFSSIYGQADIAFVPSR